MGENMRNVIFSPLIILNALKLYIRVWREFNEIKEMFFTEHIYEELRF